MERAATTVQARQMTNVRVVEPGAGRSVPFLDGSVMTFLATGADTNEGVSFWEFTLPAGGDGPPPHIHHGHDEVFFIVEGSLTVHTADGPQPAGVNSLVVVPRGAQHTFSNDGEVAMRMVGTFSPARFENYFEELAEEIAKHNGERPSPAVIAGLYAKYDSELVT
jgi:mannose-6-phosphate isomerase-like protein (cupin superfamily)